MAETVINPKAIDALNSKITSLFKYKDVTVGNITLDANGYASISTFKPSTPTGYCHFVSWITYFGGSTTKDAFCINGDYIVGTGGATITNLKVRFVFVRGDSFNVIS